MLKKNAYLRLDSLRHQVVALLLNVLHLVFLLHLDVAPVRDEIDRVRLAEVVVDDAVGGEFVSD